MIGALLFPTALVGLVVGSFLNVVAHRVPLGRSVVRPRSACPACGSQIRPTDNIPLLSWLILRGRCRDCAAPISARYPLVEAATGVLFVGVVVRLMVVADLPAAVPAYLYLAAIAVILTLIDLQTRRLPNAIVLPSYPVLAVLLTLASWGSADWHALLRALIGGAALWLVYFCLLLVRQGAMGFGDVKLAGVLGAGLAWLGWGTLVVGAFAAFLLGGLVAVGLLLARRAGRGSRIPFGPWMFAGAAVGVAVGEPLWSWYLALMV